MNHTLLAVADGVGGWNEVGVDPALFSRELCRHLSDQYDQWNGQRTHDLKELLVGAVKKT